MPPGALAGQTVGEAETLELRSIMVLGSTPQFSIYDPSRKRASWVGLNDSSQDFVVKNFDASRETVTVEYRGRACILALQKAKIAAAPPLPAVGSPSAATATTPSAPASGLINTVKINPTPAEEAQRLQAVVEEIRRRREQRRQAGQPLPTMQTPPGPSQSGKPVAPFSPTNSQPVMPGSPRLNNY
ncbi:MAG: hypothetical protein PHQ04_01725 [Opitutaceae bacterium]|nr:hypothetical protein [Opitutaceae bacterium]